jgi:hypothetical protein
MPITPLPDVSSSRGAPMGRRDSHNRSHEELPLKFFLVHLPFIDGDYDKGGAYWGGADKQMYRAESDGLQPGEECVQEMFIRAHTRFQAKEEVLKRYPNAIFYK